VSPRKPIVKKDEVKVALEELKFRIQGVESQIAALEETIRSMGKPRTWSEWLRSIL
jgi:hypothetical protein